MREFFGSGRQDRNRRTTSSARNPENGRSTFAIGAAFGAAEAFDDERLFGSATLR
jgi:hypothetical protein